MSEPTRVPPHVPTRVPTRGPTRTPKRPPRAPAEPGELQTRVYLGRQWMKNEVRRRFQTWLSREAPKIAGRRKTLVEKMVKQALRRLAEVDLTRFDTADLDWLKAALRSEMRRALPRRQGAGARGGREEAAESPGQVKVIWSPLAALGRFATLRHWRRAWDPTEVSDGV